MVPCCPISKPYCLRGATTRVSKRVEFLGFRSRKRSSRRSRSLFEEEFEERAIEDQRCRVERSLLWEIIGSLAAVGNDLRVGNQLLFSKSKIIIK